MVLTGRHCLPTKIRIRRQHLLIKKEYRKDQGQAVQNPYSRKETHLNKTWMLYADLHLQVIHLDQAAPSQRNQEWEANLLLYRIKLATLLLSYNHREFLILPGRSNLKVSAIQTLTHQLTIRLLVARAKSPLLWEAQVNWITSWFLSYTCEGIHRRNLSGNSDM